MPRGKYTGPLKCPVCRQQRMRLSALMCRPCSLAYDRALLSGDTISTIYWAADRAWLFASKK